MITKIDLGRSITYKVVGKISELLVIQREKYCSVSSSPEKTSGQTTTSISNPLAVTTEEGLSIRGKSAPIEVLSLLGKVGVLLLSYYGLAPNSFILFSVMLCFANRGC